MGRFYLVLILLTTLMHPAVNAQQYGDRRGVVSFVSEAPLEVIKASSEALRGVLNTASNEFAFTIPVETFDGFNSPLQREHFKENYMETHRYPTATFSGRIIEQIDYSLPGIYEVRAKGIFTVHGVSRERIIRSRLEVENGRIAISSQFTVFLRDHNISIPRMVHQKIAEEIRVDVMLNMLPLE